MAAEVNGSGPEFQRGTVRPLFHVLLKTGPSRYDLSTTSEQIAFESSPDGQWFVVNSPVDSSGFPIVLATNWKPGRPN